MYQAALLLMVVGGGSAANIDCTRGELCMLPAGTTGTTPEVQQWSPFKVQTFGLELKAGQYYDLSVLPNSTAPIITDMSSSPVVTNFYTNTSYFETYSCWSDSKRPSWGVCWNGGIQEIKVSTDHNGFQYYNNRVTGLPGLTGLQTATVGNDTYITPYTLKSADPICATVDQILYVHVDSRSNFSMTNQPSPADKTITGECRADWKECAPATVEDGCLALAAKGCSICVSPSGSWSRSPTCTPTATAQNEIWWSSGNGICGEQTVVVPVGTREVDMLVANPYNTDDTVVFQVTLPKGHTYIMGGPHVKDSTRISANIGDSDEFNPYPTAPINFPPVPFGEDCCQNGWNGVAAANQAMTINSIPNIGIGQGSQYPNSWSFNNFWDPTYRHPWSIYSLPNMLSGIGDHFIAHSKVSNFTVYNIWISPGLPSENSRGIQTACFDKDTTWFIYAKFNQHNYRIYYNSSKGGQQPMMTLFHSPVKVKDEGTCTRTRQDCAKITSCEACKAATGCGWCTGANDKMAIDVNNRCFLRKGGWSNLSPDESWCKLAEGFWAGENGAKCQEPTPKERAAALTGRLIGSAGDLNDLWVIPTVTILLGGIGAIVVFCGMRRRGQFQKYFGDIQRMREDLARQAEEKAAAKAAEAAAEAEANGEGPAQGNLASEG